MIRFKRNSKGKLVPFNVLPGGGLGQCHYETCTQPPGVSLYSHEPRPVARIPLDKDAARVQHEYLLSSIADKKRMREIALNRTLKEVLI